MLAAKINYDDRRSSLCVLVLNVDRDSVNDTRSFGLFLACAYRCV